MKLKVLGVIGARSGSRGLPNKNVRPLLGKPLFAWIAEAAKNSPYVTRLIMSTDSPEYARLAEAHGVEAPFLRPQEISGDTTPDFDYLHHATAWLSKHEAWDADIILRLPPTSPLCTSEHINACVQALIDDSIAGSARTVVPASKHPYKLWRTDGKYLIPFLSEVYTGLRDAHNLPRQSFPQAYQHVDVIALRRETLMEKQTMTGNHVAYVEIPKAEAIDIDNELDFMFAELLLRKRLGL